MGLFRKKQTEEKRPHPLLSNGGAADPRELPALAVEELPPVVAAAVEKPLVVDDLPAHEETFAPNALEIIAVISAAIHAYGEARGKKTRILDIQRRDTKTRSAWGAAGVAESMKSI